MKNAGIGERVVLTGACGGIGAHFARLFARKGYSLVLVGRDSRKLACACDELKREYAVACEYCVCDLAREEDIEALLKAYPHTDILVNNAGMGHYGEYAQLAWEQVRQMLMVNLVAPARLSHHYLKGMLERKKGKILNVSSTAGLQAVPLMAAYAAAKAFMNSISAAMSSELKDKNVTVSCLMPGPTATGFWHSPGMFDREIMHVRGFSRPQDVAALGIRLLEEGKSCGIPGVQNKLKTMVKSCLPGGMRVRLMKEHMRSYQNSRKGRV